MRDGGGERLFGVQDAYELSGLDILRWKIEGVNLKTQQHPTNVH